MRRGVFAALALLVAALATGAGATWVLAGALAAPVPRTVGAPPAELPGAAGVAFPSASGSQIAGWYAAPRGARGCVVLAHPVRGDRRTMAGRAAFLLEAGYAVLLFDAQAHGESPGEAITFGYLEARDAQAAVSFAHARCGERPLAFIGLSQGGAAALLAEPPLAVRALVLEAVYPTIHEAVENRLRMRLGPLARWLTPLLAAQLEPRLGIAPEQLQPIRGASRLRAPALFIAGAEDRRTTLTESRALHAAAPEPKELWVLPGVSHEDFHRRAPEEYERRVLTFFTRHLVAR